MFDGRNIKNNKIAKKMYCESTTFFYIYVCVYLIRILFQVYDAVAEDFNKELRAIKCLKFDTADKTTIEGYKKEIKLLEKLKDCTWVIHMHEL